jgi:hypothetical protein
MNIRSFRLFLILAILPCLPASAAPTLSFAGLPSSLTPGTSFSLVVDLTGASALASYNIELTLSGLGAPGTDYFFSSAVKPLSHYVFTPDDNHFLSAILSPSQKNRAVLSDFLDTGDISTIAGVNDQVAFVTITTSPTFTGPLNIGLATDSLELLDSQLDPIAGADTIANNPPTAQLSNVPEPGAISLLGIALMLSRRIRRRLESR